MKILNIVSKGTLTYKYYYGVDGVCDKTIEPPKELTTLAKNARAECLKDIDGNLKIVINDKIWAAEDISTPGDINNARNYRQVKSLTKDAWLYCRLAMRLDRIFG